jgi:hypothetical protein
MKIIIAGGSGFIGTALANRLRQSSHEVYILTRRRPRHAHQIHWDGRTTFGWEYSMDEMDAVVNLTGHGLEHWPWTRRQKQKFLDSRVDPGNALLAAIEAASTRPKVFLQISGINHYGLRGKAIADEATPAADDYLAQLTVKWESATRPVEEFGVRHVVTRAAVILAKKGGLLPLLSLPSRLFFGGKLGKGSQAMPWIHLADVVRAMQFLLEKEDARGPYNLIAPSPTSDEEFMRAITRVLHRPFWFHVPTFLLKLVLGEMNVTITEGRYSQPRRLLDEGFKFSFPDLESTLANIYSK